MKADENESRDGRLLAAGRGIYASHRGSCYRIIYDPNGRNAQKTVDSFRFD